MNININYFSVEIWEKFVSIKNLQTNLKVNPLGTKFKYFLIENLFKCNLEVTDTLKIIFWNTLNFSNIRRQRNGYPSCRFFKNKEKFKNVEKKRECYTYVRNSKKKIICDFFAPVNQIQKYGGFCENSQFFKNGKPLEAEISTRWRRFCENSFCTYILLFPPKHRFHVASVLEQYFA